MIDGVICKPLKVFHDDRGCFMEVLRQDDPFLARFGQSSFTITYPGVVKAWHYHAVQDDLWFVASGMAQIGLHDLRDESPTRGQTDVLYLGEYNRALLVIPHGVAHGYRVLNAQPMSLVYYTTEVYNPQDELRRAWDDPEIGFSWTTQNR